MLIHIDTRSQRPQTLDGAAHIVISLDKAGNATASAYFFGGFDSSLRQAPDKALLERDLPFLLAELRLQLKLDRRLTIDESAALLAQYRQSLSGSTVTE